MKVRTGLVVAVCAVFLVGSQASGQTWVLMYYMCNGEGQYSDLERACEVKFTAVAESAGNTNFVAYLLWDHVDGEDRIFKMKNETDWINGYTHNVDYWTPADLGLADPELATGDPNTLNAFVDFVVAREPNDCHYLLVVFNHGGGIHPTKDMEDYGLTGIGFDADPNGYLSVKGLGQSCAHLASQIGRKFEVLNLDACLMQMIEISHEVRNSCEYVVACENEGWWVTPSWEGGYLDQITGDPDEPNALSMAIAVAGAYADEMDDPLGIDPNILDPNIFDPNIFNYKGYTISVVDQAQTEAVSNAVDALAVTLVNNVHLHTVRNGIEAARSETQKMAYFDSFYTATQSNVFLDLKDLCEEINNHVTSMPEINDAATAVIDAIGDVGAGLVSWELHQTGLGPFYISFTELKIGIYNFELGTHGVSIFFPESTLEPDRMTYRNYLNESGTPSDLAFCADTHWDEFLRKYIESRSLALLLAGDALGTVTVETESGSFVVDTSDPNHPYYMFPIDTAVTLTAEEYPNHPGSFRYWLIYNLQDANDGNYPIEDGNLVISLLMDRDQMVVPVFECGDNCGSGVAPLMPMMLGMLGLAALARAKYRG